MAITVVDGAQYAKIATVDFSYSDAAGVTTQKVIDLPPGATVIGGEIIVDTASNDSGTDTIDVGDNDDGDRYTASPVDLKTTGRTALTLTGYETTDADGSIYFTFAHGSDDATAGAYRVNVMYLVSDNLNESHQ